MGRWARILAGTALGSVLAGCTLLTPLPQRQDVGERLSAIPLTGAPLTAPVSIRWNDHQVPFIEADSDADLAVALGIVHAHLRLGQMEVGRHISQGRLAELGGPLATDIDHSLRILDYGRGVEETVATLPPDTRAWLERFVTGVNFYIEQMQTEPHEFRVLGIEREKWTVADVLTVGRLASTDVNWLIWFSLFELRQRDDWPEIWTRLAARGGHSIPSFGPGAGTQQARLHELLNGFHKAGSNSVAIAGARTQSGAALIANDPHLGVFLPNLWLLAGYKSPSYHAVGMMIPGVPFIALGRNERIAWGGTNMRALSSDLVDVSDLPPSAFTTRREKIGVRWWFDEEVEIRDTEFGPVISDAPVLEAGEDQVLALRWMGHRASDEVTAMLRVSRAGDWDEFRDALSDFAVPGQNMVYADIDGHVGHVLAAHLPRRPNGPPSDMVWPANGKDHWRDFATAATLPAAYDPPEGYVASANNRPVDTNVPVGWFFSTDDRITRLRELLRDGDTVEVDDLKALQRDVYLASSAALRDLLLRRLPDLSLPGGLTPARQRVVDALRAWDGHYRIDSDGAVAFEFTKALLVDGLFDEEQRRLLSPGGRFEEFLGEALVNGDAARLAAALVPALDGAAEGMDEFGSWGEMHRMGLRHPLNQLPLIGGRYRFADVPIGGSSQTLMKTAHRDTTERHFTRYGSQSRHISDMSDPDANYFTLLGGQDGWINSTTFLDQLELWRRGEYVRLPLRVETVQAEFPHVTRLMP